MPKTGEQKTYAVFENPKNKKLVEKLEKSGGSVIKITPAQLTAVDDPAVNETNTFDWLIFADVCAVDFFLEHLRQIDFDLFALDDVRICALGESVADRLRYSLIHTDVIPLVNTSEAVIESIVNYIFGETELAGKRFLLLKAEGENFEFVGALEKMKAKAQESSVYSAKFTLPQTQAKIKALIKGGAIDEWIFTAPEDFLQLRFLFPVENIREVLRGTRISATDETTRQMLAENQIQAVLFTPV